MSFNQQLYSLVHNFESTVECYNASRALWEDAVARRATADVIGHGAALVRLHGPISPAAYCASLLRCSEDEALIAIDLVLYSQREDIMDAILDSGNAQLIEWLFGAVCVSDVPASARVIARCLEYYVSNARPESYDWTVLNLVNHPEIATLYPYLAHIGYDLYTFCTFDGFQRLHPLLGGGDHFLDRAVQGFLTAEHVIQIRVIVESGVDRGRALGVAMDLHRHWLLFKDDERRALARAYNVDYDEVFPLADCRGLRPVQAFVWHLAHGRDIPDAVLDAVRPLAAIIEPRVPY